MAWSDAARRAAAEARRRKANSKPATLAAPMGWKDHTGTWRSDKELVPPRTVRLKGVGVVRLKSIVQQPSEHFPARKVRINGKVVSLRAYSVRGALRSR